MRERAALVLEPRGLVGQGAAGLDLDGHVGQHELDGLELADRPAELLSLPGVRQRLLVRALGEAEPQRGDRDAAAVEDLEELGEALAARPEQVALGHPAPAERQRAGCRTPSSPSS